MSTHIEKLLHPFSVAEFIKDIYGKRTKLICRNSPSYFDYLITLDDIDKVINLHGLRQGDISLVDLGRKLDPSLYLDSRGIVEPAKVFARYSMGATIALNGFELHHPTILEMVASIEEETGAIGGANIYLTPSGSQGFQAHFDIQDVFVLQISGAKRWKLYGEGVRCPVRAHAVDSHSITSKNTPIEIMLQSGDILYLPRGHIHEAATQETHSIHITVGVLPFNWGDVMSEALQLAIIDDVNLRVSIPREIILEQQSELQEGRTLNALSEAFAKGDYVSRAVSALRRRFRQRRRTNFVGQLENLHLVERSGLEHRLRVRDRLSVGIERSGDEFILRCEGIEVRLNEDHAKAVDWMLRTRLFSMAQIQSELPIGEMEILIQQLVAVGMLVPTES